MMERLTQKNMKNSSNKVSTASILLDGLRRAKADPRPKYGPKTEEAVKRAKEVLKKL